jgi:hypothetical protein
MFALHPLRPFEEKIFAAGLRPTHGSRRKRSRRHHKTFRELSSNDSPEFDACTHHAITHAPHCDATFTSGVARDCRHRATQHDAFRFVTQASYNSREIEISLLNLLAGDVAEVVLPRLWFASSRGAICFFLHVCWVLLRFARLHC